MWYLCAQIQILLFVSHTNRYTRKLAAGLLSVIFIQVFSGWGFVIHQLQHDTFELTSEISHSGCTHSHHLTIAPDDLSENEAAYSNPELQCVYCALQWFTAPHVVHSIATLSEKTTDRTSVFAVYNSHQQLALVLPGDRAPPFHEKG